MPQSLSDIYPTGADDQLTASEISTMYSSSFLTWEQEAPEPLTMLLAGLGALGLWLLSSRLKRSA